MHMYRWIESHVVKYVNIVQVKKKKKVRSAQRVYMFHLFRFRKIVNIGSDC